MDIKNILAMYMQATPVDTQEGKVWYTNAHQICSALSDKYKLPLSTVVGVVSALSPNNKWDRNCQDEEQLIKAWHAGAEMDSVKVCTFNANKDKAWRILSEPDTDPLDILSGRKVQAFYRCISGHDDSVCVDGHAYAIFMGERIPTTQTPSIGKGLYEAIERSYQIASDHSYGLCGMKLTPAEVQATTWVTYRRLIQEG